MEVVENGCGFVELMLLVRLLGGMLPPLLLLLMLKADADSDERAARCNRELFGVAVIDRGSNTTRKRSSFEMDENLLGP